MRRSLRHDGPRSLRLIGQRRGGSRRAFDQGAEGIVLPGNRGFNTIDEYRELVLHTCILTAARQEQELLMLQVFLRYPVGQPKVTRFPQVSDAGQNRNKE